jgi:hypothetical protein
MNVILPLRSLMSVAAVLWICSCSTAFNGTGRTSAMPVVPTFSGGAKGVDIENKKALLTSEYRELAVAEFRLNRGQTSLAAMPPGRRGSAGMVATQRGVVALDSRKVARHRANIARLTRELTDAGVVVGRLY